MAADVLLTTYSWATLAVTIMLVLYPIQLIVGDIAQDTLGHTPGTPIRGEMEDFAFRAARVAGNSLENVPFMVMLILMCVALGADTGLTNGLAVAALATRLGHMIGYYTNVGRVRPISWLLGVLVMILLSGVLLWTTVVDTPLELGLGY